MTLENSRTDHTLALILSPPSPCAPAIIFLTKITRTPTIRSTRAYLGARARSGDGEEVWKVGSAELKAITIPIKEKQLRARANIRRRGDELK